MTFPRIMYTSGVNSMLAIAFVKFYFLDALWEMCLSCSQMIGKGWVGGYI